MTNYEKSSEIVQNSSAEVLENMPSFDRHMSKIQKQYENDPQKLENFNKLVSFFENDASIKKSLVDLAPDKQYTSGRDDFEYADKLYKGFHHIKSDLQEIMQDYYPSEKIEERLQRIEDDIINSGVNFDELSRVYQSDFASMSENFNKGVRKQTVGYSLASNPHAMDEHAKSVNEILHLMHASIVNNENFLQQLPILKKDSRGEVSLYGTHDSLNNVALGIFEGMKNGGFVTDIVTIKERTIMMVRDRGHALTVDIQKDPDGKYYIDYFVPKICNVDKVNMLPGVRKLEKREDQNQARDFTTGIFNINGNEDVVGKVLDFIAAVPTDDDIEMNFNY